MGNGADYLGGEIGKIDSRFRGGWNFPSLLDFMMQDLTPRLHAIFKPPQSVPSPTGGGLALRKE